MKSFILVPVLLASLAVGQRQQTFTGTITDSECARADHSAMGMGANDAECATACVYAHGASYVLWDGTTTYALSDQKAPARLAAKKVTVTGTLDEKTHTIAVESIVER